MFLFISLLDHRYIIAQLLGGYIACLLIYVQYKTLIVEADLALSTAGPLVYAGTFYTPNGPGGIFALSLLPGANLGRAFLNEFVVVSAVLFSVFARPQ
jgi:glycerol uptake facilitator-like aquaporin